MKRARRELTDDVATTRPKRDRGFSLVEIVCTICVMSIVMVPVLDSVIETIRASTLTSNLAQVETVLQNAADRVNRAPTTCDYQIYAQAAAQSEGWAATQVVTVNKHFVPGASATAAGTWLPDACSSSGVTPLLVQMVTITVTSPDGELRKTIQVVKSEV